MIKIQLITTSWDARYKNVIMLHNHQWFWEYLQSNVAKNMNNPQSLERSVHVHMVFNHIRKCLHPFNVCILSETLIKHQPSEVHDGTQTHLWFPAIRGGILWCFHVWIQLFFLWHMNLSLSSLPPPFSAWAAALLGKQWQVANVPQQKQNVCRNIQIPNNKWGRWDVNSLDFK